MEDAGKTLEPIKQEIIPMFSLLGGGIISDKDKARNGKKI
jgi:hypothetical protein